MPKDYKSQLKAKINNNDTDSDGISETSFVVPLLPSKWVQHSPPWKMLIIEEYIHETRAL